MLFFELSDINIYIKLEKQFFMQKFSCNKPIETWFLTLVSVSAPFLFNFILFVHTAMLISILIDVQHLLLLRYPPLVKNISP